MIPWELLETAAVPGDSASLRLLRRDREFSIRLGTAELMNSRLSGSEEALATLAIARLAGRPAPRILIGGLGMGFTLRAALSVLPAGATVVVAELVPAVVAWARGPMAGLFAGSLDDPRVRVHVGDVGALMRIEPGRWDAVLLDVDNGPEAMTHAANDGLYGHVGLGTARAALRGGGVLAVWSTHPDPAFARRLGDSGLAVEEVRVHANGRGKGARHVIWLGLRGADAAAAGARKPTGARGNGSAGRRTGGRPPAGPGKDRT